MQIFVGARRIFIGWVTYPFLSKHKFFQHKPILREYGYVNSKERETMKFNISRLLSRRMTRTCNQLRSLQAPHSGISNWYNQSIISFVLIVLCLSSAPSLFASGDVNLLFPVRNQTFYPDRLVRIAWDNATTSAVDVSYSLDGSDTWNTIATGVQANDFEWRLPKLDTTRITFKVQISSLAKPELLEPTMKNMDGAGTAFFSPRGKFIVSGLEDGSLNLRTTDNGVVMSSSKVSTSRIACAVMSRLYNDSVFIVSGKEIIIHNVFTLGNQVRFGGDVHNQAITSVAIHPTLPILATTSDDGSLRIWDIPSRKVLRTITPISLAKLKACTFSPDGTMIAYGGSEGLIFVTEWQDSSAMISILFGHGNAGQNIEIRSLAITPDSKSLVSGGVDKTIRIWDIEQQSVKSILFAHNEAVTCLRLSHDGSKILSGSEDSTVRQWSMATGLELHNALSVSGMVTAVDYSQTGDTLLATESTTGTISVWRNIKTLGANDTVTGYIKYPIALKVGSVSGGVGEETSIPVLLDRAYSVPYFERTIFRATCRMILPSYMVAISDSGSAQFNRLSQFRYDTIAVPLEFGSNDTVGKVRVKILLTDVFQQDTVKIIGNGISPLVWEKGVRAFILQQVEGGIIEVDSVCSLQRPVTFTPETEFKVIPQPAKDQATLNFTAYEEGAYTIEVYDVIGTNVMTIASQEFQRGEQSIPIRTSDLSSGIYSIRIVAPSKVYTVQLVVSH
jgi:WD40 repeat protein